MQNIHPTVQTIACNPTTTAGPTTVLYGETIPTGAPSRTLKGIAVTNGITAANGSDKFTVKVYKTEITAANLLATVEWAVDQAAWTGVYTDATPVITAGVSGGVLSSTLNTQFDEGDKLIIVRAVKATGATTGFVHLYWE